MKELQPYEGTEPYIFISYAHKDENAVFSFLEAMNQEGYRIWYDKGIPFTEPWMDIIATKIKQCAVCVIFYSAAAKDSDDCKREVEYIIRNKKPPALFYLEDVSLPSGLDMYLSSRQSVKRAECPTPGEFIKLLKQSEIFRPCRGQSEAERWETERQELELLRRQAAQWEAERREREERTQSASAQDDFFAFSESAPLSADDGGFQSDVLDENFWPSFPNTADAATGGTRKPTPRIRAISVNGTEIFKNDEISMAEAMRRTFERIFNEYIGASPAPDKALDVRAFIEANQVFLRFEAVDDAQFVAKTTLKLRGFANPVYLATKNSTGMKQTYVTRLCRYLDKRGQRSSITWTTTDDEVWSWNPAHQYKLES